MSSTLRLLLCCPLLACGSNTKLGNPHESRDAATDAGEAGAHDAGDTHGDGDSSGSMDASSGDDAGMPSDRDAGFDGGTRYGGVSPNAEDPGSEGDGIFQLQEPYNDAPEFDRGDDVPAGEVIRFTLPGGGQFYPDAPDRNVAVYVPKQYVKGTLAAVMVFQDGTDFFGFDGEVPPVLDNLINQGKIPPLVGVFAGNGGGDSVGSERGLEYDTVSGLYAQWANDELLPAVEQATVDQLPDQAVTFSKDPEGRAAMGGSSGGAASFSMAWWRPELFRRVLTFSGTYVNQVPEDSPFPHGAWIYHDIDPYDDNTPNGLVVAFCESKRGFKTSGDVEACDTPLTENDCVAVEGCSWNTNLNKPLRVWLQAGSNDLGAGGGPGSYRDFHLANQRLAKALQARGYHVHFDDCDGAGHVDQGPLRQTLPSALTWLWRGYKWK